MTTTLRTLTLAAGFFVLTALTAGAQTNQASSTTTDNTRPATTTFYGDTGLWFVPTAEVLPDGKWSASGYRRGTNYIQGYTNVGDFAGTFAVGIKDRGEIFTSFLFVQSLIETGGHFVVTRRLPQETIHVSIRLTQ